MAETSIGWCTHSLNFIKWWCTKVSEGCKHCYMFALAERYPQNAADHPVWREAAWKELKAFPAGAQIFCGDMYDVFHRDMPLEFIQRHFQAAQSRPDCTFLFLTKRIERAAELSSDLLWLPNIWLGTSVENRKRSYRIDVLRSIPTVNRYLSIEPLLEGLGDVDFTGMKGVIVGGESGQHRRPYDHAWGRAIQRQCAEQGVLFYLKQGAHQYPGRDRIMDGQTWDALPWRVTMPIEELPSTQLSLF